MKFSLTLLTFLIALISVEGKSRVERVLEHYELDPKMIEVSKKLKKENALLYSARKAHDYLNEQLGSDDSLIVVGDYFAAEADGPEHGVMKGDILWYAIEAGWLDKENPYMMIVVTAKDGTILAKARHKQMKTKREPVDADNPYNPPENPKNQLDD